MLDGSVDFTFLINKDISFVLNALKNLLEDDHYITDKIDLTGNTLEHTKKLSPIIISEAETLLDNPKARVYLYDRCIQESVFLVLIGEPKSLESIMSITSKTLVAEQFIRPVNGKEAVERLETLFEYIKDKGFRKKIMVVDDSPTFLRTALEWLSDDYNVSVCPSASVALRRLSEENPDLILLDYEMPVCSGIQFLEMLHGDEETKDIPVIFLTSKSDQETVSQVIAMGPQGYLLKTQPKEVILKYIQKFFYKENVK
ncbi:MAG: response regulator [Butyrivibrio sp.]|nr:response regulator [Butyrivibrio sp.]